MLSEIEWQYNLAVRRLVHGKDRELRHLEPLSQFYLACVMDLEGMPVTYGEFVDIVRLRCGPAETGTKDEEPKTANEGFGPKVVIPASMEDKPLAIAGAILGQASHTKVLQLNSQGRTTVRAG